MSLASLRCSVLVGAALLVATAAPGDVIVLEGNDVPLSGTILDETETAVRFRIRGLSENSHVVIEKDRIKMRWREASDETLRAREERAEEEAAARAAPPPETVSPPVPRSPRPRSPDEIRSRRLERIRQRLERLAPGASSAGSLILLLGFGVGVLLIWVGGRLVDMDELGLLRCALLSFMTTVFLLVLPAILAGLPDARARSAVGLLAVAAWLVVVRLVGHESLRNAVLLLSFLVLSISLLGLAGFAILSVF